MLAFGILVGTSVFVGWVGTLLAKKYPDQPPLPVLALYTVLVLAGGCASFVAFAVGASNAMFSVCLWMVIWIPTLYIYAQLVGALSAKTIVDGLFASTIKTPARRSHGRGRTLILQGHYEGAKQAFLDEFHARPKDAEPLVSGARMLANEGRHEFAVDLYREALVHFRTQTETWTEAAWMLSLLLEERMNMPNEAADLWRQIVRRAPNGKVGRQAGARLQQRVAQGHRPADL
jgi:hypothetical protein